MFREIKTYRLKVLVCVEVREQAKSLLHYATCTVPFYVQGPAATASRSKRSPSGEVVVHEFSDLKIPRKRDQLHMHHLRWNVLFVCLLLTLCFLAAGTAFAQSDVATEGASVAAPVSFNGNPVLPPKWAFGILWGSYHNQSQVLNDMKMLRSGHYGG